MRMTSALGALTIALLAGCSEPAPVTCQRFDALALTKENGFSARFDWKSSRTIDLGLEKIEVAVTAIRPIRGPIELVHLVGDTEADHWNLIIPDFNMSPTSICSISANGAPPNCGATLQNVPFSPGGYYFLRAGNNTVLEAGLAFFVCS